MDKKTLDILSTTEDVLQFSDDVISALKGIADILIDIGCSASLYSYEYDTKVSKVVNAINKIRPFGE